MSMQTFIAARMQQRQQQQANSQIESLGTILDYAAAIGADSISKVRISEKTKRPYVLFYKNGVNLDIATFSQKLWNTHNVKPLSQMELLNAPMYGTTRIVDGKPVYIASIGTKGTAPTDLVSVTELLRLKAEASLVPGSN